MKCVRRNHETQWYINLNEETDVLNVFFKMNSSFGEDVHKISRIMVNIFMFLNVLLHVWNFDGSTNTEFYLLFCVHRNLTMCNDCEVFIDITSLRHRQVY